MSKTVVDVLVPGKEYQIHIGEDHYQSIQLPEVTNKTCLIVTDSNVNPLYSSAVEDLLNANGASKIATSVFDAGEASKHLGTMQQFYTDAVKNGLDRKSIIIALGGGVTGDMAGFLAASYMRGIEFIQLPTSLLAMVDSSVGGKVGVDLPEGKNLVGAFWQPKSVVINLPTLKTLPQREILCGLAEIVKYGIIWDEKLLSFLEENVTGLLNLDFNVYRQVIERCCQIKAEVVSQDEQEKGIRAILNYGHTFGHSIEMLGGFELLNHGEGVAIGMVIAAQLAVNLGKISQDIFDRQLRLLKALGLPTTVDMEPAAILEGMRADKKNQQGRIHVVIPEEKVGKVIVTGDISEREILTAIKNVIEQEEK